MFSTNFSRAALRAATASGSSSTGGIAQRTSQCLATRPAHQRRHSSSKTSSWPPDSTPGGKPAPATAVEEKKSEKSEKTEKSGKGRARGVVKKVEARKEVEPVDHYAGLPSVPSTQDLDAKQLKFSNFFSLHRPISLGTTIPPPASQQKFNDILDGRSYQDPWANGNSAERRPEDVIYTLHHTIEALENSQEEGVRFEVLHESPSNSDGVRHLDSVPRLKTLEEVVSQYRPFNPPPPPQPFPELDARDKKSSQKAAKRGPKQKIYVTEIRLTESTSADGRTTYTASSSPIMQLPDETQQSQVVDVPPSRRLSFRARMRSREERHSQEQHQKMLKGVNEPVTRSFVRRAPSAGRLERMQLISVKRQRKLKMKKHKYKKLMKRTRNLRRRIERG